MTLLDFLMILAAIVGLSLLLSIFMLASLLRSIDRKMEKELEQALAQSRPRMIGLAVEQVQDVFYCYNAETQQFVCQGRTVDELRDAFSKRFPHHTAYLAAGDDSVIEQFRAVLAKDKND